MEKLYFRIFVCVTLSVLANSQPGCVPNCQACTDTISCDICSPGYGVSVSEVICEVCDEPNCNSCPADAVNCMGCEDGFYFNPMDLSCTACSDVNCQSCHSWANICTACKSGWVLWNDECVERTCADPNCQECHISAICDICKMGYGLDSGVCIKCTVANCERCDADPADCSATHCSSGYGYIAPAHCAECTIANCYNCDGDADECSPVNCGEGYGYIAANPAVNPPVLSSCSQCTIAHCAICDGDADSCMYCQDGYYYGSAQPGSPVEPAKCEVCNLPGCTSCSDDNKCEASGCLEVYAYRSSDMDCVPCDANCDLQSCTYMAGEGVRCSSCAPGYRVSDQYTCDACPFGCHSCYQNDGEMTCMKCLGTHYANYAECVRCPSNCLECTDNNGVMNCDKCADDYVLEAADNRCQYSNDCLSSPCQHGGICTNHDNRFVCTCVEPWAGTVCEIEIQHDTVISTVFPNYGPVDGGTNMTLTGQHLDVVDDVTIIIADMIECNTIYKNDTHAIAQTIAVDERDDMLVDKPLPITVKLSGGKIYETTEMFTYRGNPVIKAIHPLDTLQSGGTNLTVSGDNLDSVAQSYLVITMRLRYRWSSAPVQVYENETIYTSPCLAANKEIMICRTPQFEIPEGFNVNVESTTRKKRTTYENVDFELHGLHRVLKRDTTESVHDNSIDFYIGFKMDGVMKYENLSEALPEYSELNVVNTEPTFDFGTSQSNKQKVFKPGERIEFQGTSLDVGCTASDYIIEIGRSICSALELTSNSVSCLPPDEKPELQDGNMNSQPQIIINIGLYISHYAGTLEYPHIPYHIILPSTILGATVIVVLVTVTCICVRRNTSKRDNDSSKQGDAEPNISASNHQDVTAI